MKITEVVVTPPPPAPSTTPTRACPRAKTLEDLITCIKAQMPSRYSEGFVVPPEHVQSDWHSVVAQMLDGQSDDITLPSSLSTVYSVTTFTDTDNGRSYCVLMETGDIDNDGVVDRGWGTFIVDREATKELSIQIAHPKFDIGTADQGIGVFKGTSSRSFLMAGTHRYANGASSTCQPSFLQADAAHSDETLFYVTVRELVEFYDVAVGQLPAQGSFVAIQFHGMGSSNCPSVDVYMTYGVNSRPAPGDKLLDLQASLERHHPDWVVTVPGDSPRCGLHGSKNVPGRLLNNVAAANLCTTAASTDSGRFIHIEQKRDCRDPNDWIATVNEVFPATASVPAGQ
ncbi:MAG: hypothetical protein ISS52_05380 [Dehalococcoidia bacterium]|nr:hypothetical protein [Dehalococcoidia bacterium]